MNRTWTVDITFKNLTYSVADVKKEKKNVLNSISGCFKSGELTAIMGPSGAGKSSLLNILTGFIKEGVKGEIKFGSVKNGRKCCSYILQEDHFFPWFTVDEIMMFAATIKISNNSMSMKEKQILIENILHTLHLRNARKTKCGTLSGGQKKRLSIALELIDNPPVLFLDEPTTGLDSSSSADVVDLLELLSKEGRTIVCTIHQPSASIYHLFSHIYVLDQGYCVYQGTPRNTVPFLNSFDIQCPQYHNPADFLLEVVSGEHGNYTKQMIEGANRSNEWRYDLIDEKDTIVTCANHPEYKRNSSISNWSSDSSKHTYPPPEWIRLWLLIGRCHIQFYRDWSVTHLKLIAHIFCSIIIGLLFGDSGTNASKVFSNISLFTVAIVYLWYTTMMPGVLRFPMEILIIRKETFNSWYKLRTYYLAALITSTPVHILFSTTFTTIAYLMTDQPFELERYIKFAFTTILLTIAADAFGVLLGTLANPVNGTFFGAVLTCFMLIFSGFLILFEHMPNYMKIISYLSAHRYGLESLVLSAYGKGREDMICPDDVVYCHLRKPSMILKSLGMDDGNYNFNVIILLLQISLFKGVAYFTLKRALRSGNNI